MINKSILNATIGLYTDQTFSSNISRKLQEEKSPVLMKKARIDRYDYVPPQKASDIISLGYILNIAAWIAIIGAIVSVPISMGVVCEEFILSLQLVFLHVYIYSEYLPLSLKDPLRALQRIENFDYFMPKDASRIEDLLLGKMVQSSPLRFTQFNTDVNFTRAFYPIFLVNVIFLVWYCMSFFIHKILKKLEDKGEILRI